MKKRFTARYSKYKIRHTSIGFTLIEMLVVISIIGILAVLVAANLNSARGRARDAERKSDIKNIETAMRLYYNDYGSYPSTNSLPWASKWSNGSIVYMETLPQDPLSPNQKYQYKAGTAADNYTTKDNYTLVACLENSSDPSAVNVPNGFTCPGSAFVITQ